MTGAMENAVAGLPRMLITRPEPDAAIFAKAARAAGFEPVLAPMMRIIAAAPPALDGAGAVAFTSANGVRVAGPPPADWSGTVFAVGPSTAAAALAAGWAKVETASGDVAALAAQIVARAEGLSGPVLHVAGSHRAGDLVVLLHAANVPALRHVAYEAREAQGLPDAAERFLATLTASDWAAFFSPRTAEIFLRLTAGREATLAALGAVALSEPVAVVLRRARWRRVAVAAAPSMQAILAAAT